MAEQTDPKAEAAAEKAYAAASEAAPLKALAKSQEPVGDRPIEFPTKEKRSAPPAPTLTPTAAEREKAKPEIAEAVPQPVKAAEPARKADKAPARPARPRPVKKPAAKAKSAKPAKPGRVAKSAPGRKAGPAVAKRLPLPAKPVAPTLSKPSPVSQTKEQLMEKTSEFVDNAKKAAADTQAQAKKAFEKSTAIFGDYAEFAKGNVEACIESGKILAAGIQDMGSRMVAESKTAFETASSDVKQLAAVKSPSDFIKLQTDILRRNFDSAIALGSKNSEAVIKLASDSFAPISGRVTLAVDKIKQAA